MEDIDEIHRLLGVVDEELFYLQNLEREQINVVEDLGELCLVIGEIFGWGSVYYDDVVRLGINPTILNKFAKMRGSVKKRDAVAVAERVRSYLRSLDQKTLQNDVAPFASAKGHTQPTQILTVRASEWVAIEQSASTKGKILAIAALLDNIIEQTKKSNLPPDEQILTEIERNQLIAILETALQVLKSPLAEKGLMSKAREELEKAARSAAEKGVQTSLGHLAGMAVEKITDLLRIIF
ncbi:MAG: hypothetical protein NVV83_16940 [Afipia sp.]|nr:hypothetical protein [Afipia sp.]